MIEASQESYSTHKSVLLEETVAFVLDFVSLKIEPVIVDFTFGGGGHSFEMLKRNPTVKIIAFDKDIEAYQNGLLKIQESGYSNRINLIHSDFVNLKEQLKLKFGLEKIDGIIADLGVSSHHFDDKKRGFSYSNNAPLDMRMDTINNPLSAYEVVNSYDEEDLTRIITEYGEENFAKRIAKNIIEFRMKEPIKTTEDLEKIVFHSYPSKFKKTYRTHPATKTFQAIRIEVNNELKHLEQVLPDALSLLSTNSCLAIISFHSLEDRIVKHFFKAQKENKNFKTLTKKPIIPTEAELKFNPRSRSAKLRVIARVEEDVR